MCSNMLKDSVFALYDIDAQRLEPCLFRGIYNIPLDEYPRRCVYKIGGNVLNKGRLIENLVMLVRFQYSVRR